MLGHEQRYSQDREVAKPIGDFHCDWTTESLACLTVQLCVLLFDSWIEQASKVAPGTCAAVTSHTTGLDQKWWKHTCTVQDSIPCSRYRSVKVGRVNAEAIVKALNGPDWLNGPCQQLLCDASLA